MEFLPLGTVRKLVREALREDVGPGDVTTLAVVPEGKTARAAFVAREPMVVAGLPVAEAVFQTLSKRVHFERKVRDGDRVEAGQAFMIVEGPARAILSGERVALNYLKRLCGIATLTAQFVEAVRGTGVTILDTRKTTPGWRILEKYAVRCGGGKNHRMGLYDMVVIKDNHLAILDGAKPHPIVVAVRRARERWPNLLIEVETETLEQVQWAVEAGADWIMLDNMSVPQLREAVRIINGRVRTEASGKVTLENVRAIAECGVDYISVGALTHSARAVDIGLDFCEPSGTQAYVMNEERPKAESRLDVEIFRRLLEADHHPVSGEELALRLGVTRAAVWNRIQALRERGYRIEAAPHVGYRLLELSPLLCAEEIQARLEPECIIGRRILVYRKTGSTMDIADRLGRDGLPEGCVVFAEEQTAGRGRLGREWFSPPGTGLWFSILLRPPLRPTDAGKLTLLTAVGCIRVLERFTERPLSLKWPNDVMADGRKLAGILTEMRAEQDQVQHAVVGIGINVNQRRSEFPPRLQLTATSLRVLTGRTFHRNELAAALLSELDALYGLLCQGGWEEIAREWRLRTDTLGKRIRGQTAIGELVGIAEALDEDGLLMLRTDDGRLIRLSGGLVVEEQGDVDAECKRAGTVHFSVRRRQHVGELGDHIA